MMELESLNWTFAIDTFLLLVTEKVFGFLLAALGVQLALSGLADVGVIHLTGH